MPAQIGYYDSLKSVAGKVFSFLASITLTGTDGKTITCTQDTSLDEAVAMSSKAPKTDTIKGDGTAGRVIRTIYLYIQNGTNANTIKPLSQSVWNGDTNGVEDNLAKGGDTGVFALNAGGGVLTLQDAGISGSAIAIFSVDVVGNATGTPLMVNSGVSGGGMDFYFYNSSTGAGVDLVTLVDTAPIQVNVTYLTSA